MKKVRASDVVYNYTKNHATREQLIQALECCSNPTEGCAKCIYKQMKIRGCTARLMEDAIHELQKEEADE